MSYHYTDSGLDYVILEDGYTVHETTQGEGVSIKDLDGLHRVIGGMIVRGAAPIRGMELRFLRLELELSPDDLAGHLGASEDSVKDWEKATTRPIAEEADRRLRALFT